MSKQAAEYAGSIQLNRCDLRNCLNLEIVVEQLLLNATVFGQNHNYNRPLGFSLKQ